MLNVRGAGFMRYQIRMMMGALVLLGKGAMDMDMLKRALEGSENVLIPYVAPGSGLLLRDIEFK
jgi:tRNA pseudouridine38-40 synthase